jgi:BON domain-containing protein
MRSDSDIWDPDIDATDIAVAVKNGIVTLTGFVRSYSQKCQAKADMQSTTETTLTELVHEAANPLTGAAQDYDPLIERIGAARFVLLGEASHGTHDFYSGSHPITM